MRKINLIDTRNVLLPPTSLTSINSLSRPSILSSPIKILTQKDYALIFFCTPLGCVITMSTFWMTPGLGALKKGKMNVISGFFVSQVSSSEYFSVCFDTENGFKDKNEIFIAATKGIALG